MARVKKSSKKLLLLAPYYSLGDVVKKTDPYVPDFILKYQINTYYYIQHITSPIVIFHGDRDEEIYYGSSLKLKQYFKPGDTLITLPGEYHNGIEDNALYLQSLKNML